MNEFHLNDSVPTPSARYAEDLARYTKETPPETLQNTPDGQRLWDHLFPEWLLKLLSDETTMRWILGTIVVALLIFVFVKTGWFEGLRRRFLLRGREKQQWEEADVDTDIYAHDLPEETQRAEAAADFPELVKLLYLTALRRLCDIEVLEWRPARTPSDYVALLTEAHHETRTPMSRLTRHYLYVCFGHYAPTADTVAECRNLLAEVERTLARTHMAKKGGEA